LLGIHRSGLYYNPTSESSLNRELTALLLEKHLEKPFYGVPRLHHWLKTSKCYNINKKRVERLCRKAGIQAIVPKPNTSKANKEHIKFPYLLRDLEIERVNQVWETDITYIPMRKGHMYLMAIIDVYSRYIVSWSISNTMDAKWCRSIVQSAVEKHGKPEIINTDQGSQYTSEDFVSLITDDYKIKFSMDGKGRALDNIFIERLWRSLKYEHVYLYPADGGLELYKGCKEWFDFYNTERPHQSLNMNTPEKKYFSFNHPT